MSHGHGRVDVIIVGAGPAGLAAACAVAERGRQALVVDAGANPGGQIWRHRDESDLIPRARAMLQRARSLGVRVASGARVVDALSPRQLVVEFGGRTDLVDTSAVILATGAREIFLPFPGWTLPGVVGAGGLQALIKSGLDLRGKRVVIAGSGPLLLVVADTVRRAGGEVVLVAEQATTRSLLGFGMALTRKPSVTIRAFALGLGSRRVYHPSSWIMSARGRERVEQVTARVGSRVRSFACDWVAAGFGLVPQTELAALVGCDFDAQGIRVDHAQSTSVAGVWAAGECTGIKGDIAAVIEGQVAGAAAAGDFEFARRHRLTLARGREFGDALSGAFKLRSEVLQLCDPNTIVCRCEDVRRGAIDAEWTSRQAKLWTRVGMGECQGAVCGPACSLMFGWDHNVVRNPLGAPLVGPWCNALQRHSGSDSASSASAVSC